MSIIVFFHMGFSTTVYDHDDFFVFFFFVCFAFKVYCHKLKIILKNL